MTISLINIHCRDEHRHEAQASLSFELRAKLVDARNDTPIVVGRSFEVRLFFVSERLLYSHYERVECKMSDPLFLQKKLTLSTVVAWGLMPKGLDD